MGDDDFNRVHDQESSPSKAKLNRLEKEEITYEKAYSKLVCVMIVSTFFVGVQLAGGIISGSIAIFTDCAHLATDMLGFVMSMYALKVSLRPASKELTFGWHRAEIIGTLSSVMFLLTITIWLVYEATKRVIHPVPVKGFEMLVTAICAFFFNLVQMSMLHQGDIHYHMGGEIGGGGGCGHDHGDAAEGEEHTHDGDDHGHAHDHGHDHAHELEEQEEPERRNINLDAAFLHALGDMFLSLGVCVAATIIYFKPEYTLADPICTFVFSIIVFFTVTPITKNCVSVLMESAPSEINIEKLISQIKNETAATEIHDFHLWQISVGRYALSCHIDSPTPMETLKEVTKICKVNYSIDHLTIQMEDTSSSNDHQFKCDQTTHKKIEF
jgi:zinc transporter 2